MFRKLIPIVLIFLISLFLNTSYSQDRIVYLKGSMKFNYFVDIDQQTFSYVTNNKWRVDSITNFKFWFFNFKGLSTSSIVKYDSSLDSTEEIQVDHGAKEYTKKVHKGNVTMELWNKFQIGGDSQKNQNKTGNEQNKDNLKQNTPTTDPQVSVNYKPSVAVINSNNVDATELEISYKTNNQSFKVLIKLINSKDLKKFFDDKTLKEIAKYLNKYKINLTGEMSAVGNIPQNIDKEIKKILDPVLKQGRDLIYDLKLLTNNKPIIEAVFFNEIKVLPYKSDYFEIPQGYSEKK
ncbi:MAG: hypothetical protein NZM44_03540 [Candidatus Calescibacterium sp.]|nr:hypothetical protein [Candidatus Calescibacterium sp.]